jgi:hypothetical protein
MNRCEIADLIARCLTENCGEWEWDDFISIKQADPEIEDIRIMCGNLPKKFPPNSPYQYCNEEGIKFLKATVEKLRTRP